MGSTLQEKLGCALAPPELATTVAARADSEGGVRAVRAVLRRVRPEERNDVRLRPARLAVRALVHLVRLALLPAGRASISSRHPVGLVLHFALKVARCGLELCGHAPLGALQLFV